MITFWQSRKSIRDQIYLPKYYDPELVEEINQLEGSHELVTIRNLVEAGVLRIATGDEIGKLAYGTGSIPFVRTSDISNWEIKSAPKQGVSEDVFRKYSEKQDVQDGDVLLVRDGTYLIGTNCFVSNLDQKLVYQSHILKIRVLKRDLLDPQILFLLINSSLVQRQFRSVQFTADTIDTLGNRYLDVVLPVPKNSEQRSSLSKATSKALKDRRIGKAFIKQAPFLIEQAMVTGDPSQLASFQARDLESEDFDLNQDTVTAEFGTFQSFFIDRKDLKDQILLPKYYAPEIEQELSRLSRHCNCSTMSELAERGVVSASTGDEIGKMAYGTGSIPFLRTSDFSNWEVKHDPKQGVSQAIYDRYAEKQDMQPNDILLVRDGTYLVGNSCIVTKADQKSLFCGGLYKIRAERPDELDPYLLLGLLNSYIVKRQIRTKQFTRDVIDTIGRRLWDIILPIPKDFQLRCEIAEAVKNCVEQRVSARTAITDLSKRALKK